MNLTVSSCQWEGEALTQTWGRGGLLGRERHTDNKQGNEMGPAQDRRAHCSKGVHQEREAKAQWGH